MTERRFTAPKTSAQTARRVTAADRAVAADPEGKVGRPNKTNKRAAPRGTKRGQKSKTLDVKKPIWSPHTRVRIGPQGADLFNNPDSVKDWDDEELMRGQRRAKNGSFIGKPPAIIPRICYQEMVRRQLEEAQQEMIDHLGMAVERLVVIATAPGFDAKDQLTAIKMIMDRVMGTAPQRIAIGDENSMTPWAQALVHAIVDMPDDIEDAEIIEDDED